VHTEYVSYNPDVPLRFCRTSSGGELLEDEGVIVLTDANVYQDGLKYDIGEDSLEKAASYRVPRAQSYAAQNAEPQFPKPARVREISPESWLWTDAYVGVNGSASITATVPDTITSWVVSAFAINSNSGLGVAQTQARLKVFRPFFVSLNLPYSVTRGEQLAFQANVFNYLPADMQVRVTLAASKRFHNIFIDATGNQELKQVDVVQDIMVKAGEAKSVYFPIVPADLGRIDVEVKAQSTKAADAVRRQLLVEAEGVPKQYNVPVLIDLRDGKKTFSKTIDLTLPDNVMKGSELVRISAVGDLMGPTIAGLASVLQLPTGCGEQTMLDLAADVYVTDYLDCVNQLNGDVKTKAINFMESGYQGVLTYKHSDGSFSAFGTSDKSGSMWLTAFVARVFHQAKRHIFVDDNIISDAILWMIQHQKTDGSFPEPGVDQAGSGVKLTLFVLISLLENRDDMKFLNVDEAIQKALSYAEQEVAKLDDLYVLAMASYAFQLAGSNMTQAVLDKLEAESTQKYGMKYWHQSDQPKIITSHSPNPTKAVDIEMTAYVLLTYTKRGDLVAGKSIMQWITKQRNANGCFTSTQDTVVALNALSEYSKQTYSNKLKLHITTQLDDESTYTFDINNTNLLLLQSRKNTKVPAQVVITATGSGLALVQAAVSFNVLSDIVPENFNLKLEIVKENLTYLDVETCTRWIGKGTNSAMAVQEFGIPSGFAADLDDLTKLDILKRVETQNKKVILYFDKIGTTPVCLNLRVRRVDFVAKSQPAAVRVYDYYEPRNQVTVFYQSQLLKDSTICDVCRECEKCQPPIEQEELKVFRQFFVSLNLPYSVTRDEQLALQANVFNYLPDDMQVQVTLAKSKRFHNIFIDTTGNQELKQVDVVQDVLVKAGEAKSVYFPIVPADLGRIDVEVKAQSTKAADTVRRQLLVEAEGVPKQYNVPVLIDLTDGKKTFSKTIALTLPNNVVKGSELVRISAVGDLMGPTIAGLGSLLQIPTGCGEQTMLDLAADVYVTDYLDCVNQLNEDIKTKAIDFMESGFQGVLTYKHSDGSFSAFGNRDKSGSMWLTAFVARVFHQAKGHIFVDENILNDAIQWMIQQQNTDGSFPEPGVVLSRTIQDQAGSGVKLTLFVLISLLENLDDMKYLNVDEAIQKALAYAEQEVAKLDDLYVLAMASYAFQLAGSNMTQAVLDKLEAESTQKDGMRYWQQPDPLKIITRHSPNPAKAVDIEMTAYVLLTYTKRGDLVAGKSIMQWITKQRNAKGGFTSTRDTVVALNALSEYAKQTYSNKLQVHITTQLDDETTYNFDIDKTNSLVLQARENTKVPAQVVITATGSGMALVQAALSFNVLSDIEPEHFDIELEISYEDLIYLGVITCTRWIGKGTNSAMAVQEFGIPSGFEADLESFTELDIVKRVETQNKKLILYFDKIGRSPECFYFKVRRVDFVAKSQPAAVRVYDYYEPSNQVTVFYQSQLLEDSTICDVCRECENCPPVTEQEEVESDLWDKCKAIFDWCAEIIFDIIHLL
ncbi:CD109 antigen-like, partial [Physella acuta]|uniref:CD109 antigen-like n=1 Tax=Physella acuta TaxID=109671 RepID=UPI0027DB4AFE